MCGGGEERRGETGRDSDGAERREGDVARWRADSSRRRGVGVGGKTRADGEARGGKADMGVVGSETIRVMDEQGVGAVGEFIASLRQEAA